jgi:hypothetical protein
VEVQAWPGGETLANAATAKGLLEKLGARVRALQPLVAGANTADMLFFVTEFDSMAAYGKFAAKSQTDAAFQTLWQTSVLSPEPAATMASSSLAVTIPGMETVGPAAKGTGPRVITATIVQPLLGREMDTVAAMMAVAPIISKLGARVTGRNVLVGGPTTGQMSFVAEYDDLAAFGTQTDKLLASADYQAWLQKHTFTNPAAAIVGRSVLIQVL